MNELIDGILTAAGKIVRRVVNMYTSGDIEGAKREAERFIATTQRELGEDRAEADAFLDGRFHRKTDPPPASG